MFYGKSKKLNNCAPSCSQDAFVLYFWYIPKAHILCYTMHKMEFQLGEKNLDFMCIGYLAQVHVQLLSKQDVLQFRKADYNPQVYVHVCELWVGRYREASHDLMICISPSQ